MNNVMEKQYQIALAQVDEILHFTDNKIILQIPSSFFKFIKENKDNDYISNINPYMSLEEQDITDEAKAIISLIYRNYIANEEEKESFHQKDKDELDNIEKQKIQKYNPDDIFKNKIITMQENIQKNSEENGQKENALVIIEKNTFVKIYNKIRDLIAKIFYKNKN